MPTVPVSEVPIIQWPRTVARGVGLRFAPMSSDERRTLQTVAPFTMVGVKRLRALWRLANRARNDRVPGAFVECGTCNGGSGAILAKVGNRDQRATWLFDSFAGLPEPGPKDGQMAENWTGECLGSEASVQKVLDLIGCPPGSVTVVKGWFEETLAAAEVGSIALLHMDGDWYQSTRTILETLFDRVVPGGFVVVDDYGHWPGCRRAVDEFFAERGLSPRLHRIDYTGVWLRKAGDRPTDSDRDPR